MSSRSGPASPSPKQDQHGDPAGRPSRAAGTARSPRDARGPPPAPAGAASRAGHRSRPAPEPGRSPGHPRPRARPGRAEVLPEVGEVLDLESGRRTGLHESGRLDRVGLALAVRRAPGRHRAGAARRSPGVSSGAGRARSACATAGSSPGAGTAPRSRPRPCTGSSSWVQPSRRASRPKWVSTVMPGTPKALPSTTFAVLRPTPGSVTRSRSRLGTSPPKPLAERLPEAQDASRLGAEEAGRLDHRLQLGAVGGRVGRGGAVAREERRRHEVHPHIRALRRQDRRHQQLAAGRRSRARSARPGRSRRARGTCGGRGGPAPCATPGLGAAGPRVEGLPSPGQRKRSRVGGRSGGP